MSDAGTATLTTTMATFLMTDIEGSTRLWEEHPDSMAAVLERHDGILRDAIVGHGGTVIKTTGDGMLAAFTDPVAAGHAAIEGQRGLVPLSRSAGTSIRVRMALHTGGAQERDDDYFGPAVNRIARLLAIGHGGQILVSGVTAGLTRDRLGPDVDVIDRGDHVLRDLLRPERVYQLVASGLERDFPPLRSAGDTRSNLPIQVTSFVGREAELDELERLTAHYRMVTLIGTGGTGKTRLMLEAAPRVAGRYPDGVRLAELARTSDPDLVASEVVRALGGREQPGSSAIGTLVDLVRYKQLLLLLDNCEHVVGAAADLATRILANCPDVTILATSREALGIDGEHIYQVPSLGLIRSDRMGDARLETSPDQFRAIATAGAVRLFVDRATAAVPGFELTEANGPTVAEICERLDGIPLAIELAAARVAVLSVDDILGRLGDRFRLLTGGRRTAVPRQQTLQALVDWSWDLLVDPDRRLLRRLSVFAGGWTLEAASAVCGEPGDDVMVTLDALTRLVQQSLVDVDRSGVGTRYRSLETIRQYSRDRLIESGEADLIRRRHLDFFEGLVEREVPRMIGAGSGEALASIDAESDNVRAAIEWGIEAEPEAAGRLCVAMWLYWRSRWTGQESATWLSEAADRVRALPRPADPDASRARDILLSRLLSDAAFATTTRSSRPAIPMAEAGLELARRLDDEPTLIEALAALWTARFFAGDRAGLGDLAAEQLALAERQGDLGMMSLAQTALATSTAAVDPARARALLESAGANARRTGNAFAIGFASLTRGRIMAMMGEIDTARVAFDEAFAVYSEIGDEGFALASRSDLGHALRMSGRNDEAAAVYRETIKGWAHLGNRGAIANQFEAFAYLAIDQDDLPRAARLLGAAEALREASDARMLPDEERQYAASMDELRTRLDASSLATGWAAGRSMSVPAAVDLASLVGNGGRESRQTGRA